MVGAGVLIEALVGIDFALAVVITGAFMIIYIVAGGMLATSWVQIIKAFLLMSAAVVMSACSCWRRSAGIRSTCSPTPRSKSAEGEAYLEPGLFLATPLDTVSLGIGLVLGTAGLPHILMRFFTVPDAKAARGSVMWAVVPDRRVLRDDHVPRLRRPGDPRPGRRGGRRHRRQPRGAAARGGARRRRRHLGGDLFLAIIAAVAFATILAVVAGLVISASGAVAHDVWSNIVRKGQDSEKEEVWVAKIAAVVDRRDRDRDRRDRRRGPERLVHGRPGVRRGG